MYTTKNKEDLGNDQTDSDGLGQTRTTEASDTSSSSSSQWAECRTEETNNDTTQPTPSQSDTQLAYIRPLLPLAIIGFIDAVSLMIVLPSLIFYVQRAGGTKEQYGIVWSSFAFASFFTKPVLGYWSDHCRRGPRKGGYQNHFRAPYLTSIAIATLGAFLYFAACLVAPYDTTREYEQNVESSAEQLSSTVPVHHFSTAMKFILAGRILNGMGAANNSLGYAYIAQVIPQQHMTQASAVLSMIRVFGMSIAPAFNILLNMVHYTVTIPFLAVNLDPGQDENQRYLKVEYYSLEIDPMNVVGIVLVLSNLIGFLVIWIMLEEPDGTVMTSNQSTKDSLLIYDEIKEECQCKGGCICDVNASQPATSMPSPGNTTIDFVRQAFRREVAVPILAYFTLNFNFQFMETGLAPAANDALGWGTVAISTVFGIDAILIFFVYMITFQLSAHGVNDISLMKTGLVCSVLGYSSIYLTWYHGTRPWMFVLPGKLVVCSRVCERFILTLIVSPVHSNHLHSCVSVPRRANTEHLFIRNLAEPSSLSSSRDYAGFAQYVFQRCWLLGAEFYCHVCLADP